ncbi:MAG: fumarylacetoacetase [Lentimicrobium sp.]|jgi:fumarylacetoacetase|nr:fumarylacetoacetase [Lentimicrobium sp.]
MENTKLQPIPSWVEGSEKSGFPLNNLPFGIAEIEPGKIVGVTRIGDQVVNLEKLAELKVFSGLHPRLFKAFSLPVLNYFIELGRDVHHELRERLQQAFGVDNTDKQQIEGIKTAALLPFSAVKMQMPLKVTDYTDFYSSIEHATNVGKMFRDPENALLPNWRHLPVGYHGRASSIVVSGTPIHRPLGQTKPADSSFPVFGPSKMLDFELEMAFVVGKNTSLGDRVPVEKAREYIFGLMLFNDLSARDIQSWEYVPLGPFLAKNFGSVVAPWIVTLEALEPFRVDGPPQEPEVLPYLKSKAHRNYDVQLEVAIRPENGSENVICRSNYKHMYWNMDQQLAHHTVNGCNITVGDLYASGTISGSESGSFGSMLELTWRGANPIKLNDGSERKFLNDNDTVVMRGSCRKDGIEISFGECESTLLAPL